MTKWQSNRRLNFRSQPILSDFLGAVKRRSKCLNAGVDYTVLHAIVVHADWPVQMLSVAITNSLARAARSSIRQKIATKPLLSNFPLLGDQIQIYPLTAFKQEEERDSKSRRKKQKQHGAVYLVQLQVLLNWPSTGDRRCNARGSMFQKKKKKALDSKLWRKEHSIRTLLMIE